MAQGKKTDIKTIYAIIASWAITGNYSETSRVLNIPVKTVEKIVKDNKDNEEFERLISRMREDFENEASEIINKGLKMLNRRLDIALHNGRCL